MSRLMCTHAEREAETKESRAQKGAQHQNTFGRGCARCAGQCVVTDGVTADCAKADELIENIGARGLIADRAYDSDKIVQSAENLGMEVVIPPRKNRKVQRKYDKNTYKIRRLVENAFLHLKR